MKSTIVLCSHNRPIHAATHAAIAALCAAGAGFLEQTGATDVSLARNLALSGACEAVRTQACRSPARLAELVVLMVDDDMVFSVPDAEQLVQYARRSGVAVSAMYATTMGTLAAMRMRTPEGAPQLWATGLGMLAIPATMLLELEGRSESFKFLGRTHYGFTWSHAERGNYWSEDFTLCRRLGGVHLLPIAVGHMKMVPLYPDDETIACIAEGRWLPGDVDEKILEHLADPLMVARSSGLLDAAVPA